jgi:phosphoglucosamine mutase
MKIFGTDGIRGRANVYPMTADLMLKIACIIGRKFQILNNNFSTRRVIIGKDTRESGYLIENALAAGFLASGMNVIFTGPVPTPAISMLTKSMRADLGVMISASHNGYLDNGIKIFDRNGVKISKAFQAEIEAELGHDFSKYYTTTDHIGRAKRFEDVASRYVEFVKATFPKNLDLRGLKIVLDTANGAAYKFAPEIFWELGAEVIPIANNPNGRNINEKCGSTHPELIASKVLEHKADIGIALDGDADRLIIADENGSIIDGDFIIAAIAKFMQESGELRQNAIVATVMSNIGFEQYINSLGLDLIRTAVGDQNVVSEMLSRGINLGGEKSGHIILSDYSFTGDGLISALKILALVRKKGENVSRIMRLFTPTNQVQDTFVKPDGFNMDTLEPILTQIRTKLPKPFNLVVRPSGTEPIIRIMIDAQESTQVLKEYVSEIKKIQGLDI